MNILPWNRYNDGPRDERARLNAAFDEGRRQERSKITDRTRLEADVRRAYERGRRDERARRHGSPLVSFLLLVVAAIGAAAIGLAIHEGSFQRGGQVVDQSIAGARQSAAQATQSAASKAGDALQNAGADLKPAGNQTDQGQS